VRKEGTLVWTRRARSTKRPDGIADSTNNAEVHYQRSASRPLASAHYEN